MGPIQSLEDFLGLLRRRRWLILGVLCAGMALSVIYALRQAHVYEATAVIQIEAPKVADALAPSTVETSAARRLQMIEQQMMARDSVLALIRRYGLFADLPALTETEKVVRFRNLTRITGLEAVQSGTVPDGSIAGVSITVRMGSPELAKTVTNALADQLIALGRDARLERTRTTLDFFAEREAGLEAEIAALEDRITDFRKEHELSVSGGLQFRRVEIQSLQEAIIDIDRERLVLRAKIDRLAAEPQVAVTLRRIDDLRDQLATFDAQRDMLSARSAGLAAAVQSVPEVEHQLGSFQNRLERLQEQYALATQNRADAETAHRMELTDQAERLRLIEPAIAPDYPVAPSRKKIALQGTLASLVLALALAFGLDLRRPVIRTSSQMQRETGLLPVVAIPHFRSPHEANRPRARQIALAAGSLAVLLGGSLLLTG